MDYLFGILLTIAGAVLYTTHGGGMLLDVVSVMVFGMGVIMIAGEWLSRRLSDWD